MRFPYFNDIALLGPSASCPVVSSYLGHSQIICLTQANNNTWNGIDYTGIHVDGSLTNGAVTFSCWFCVAQATPDQWFEFMCLNGPNSWQAVDLLVWHSWIAAAVSNGTNMTQLLPYQVNVWYHISATLNFTSQTYSAWINGTQYVTCAAFCYTANNVPYVNDYHVVECIQQSTGTGQFYCDNFVVRGGSSVPPSAPTLAAITPNPSTGSVQLNWSAVVGATSYKVYRASSSITDVTGLTPIATPSTIYSTDSLSTSGTYWYAVVATNDSGDSVVSNSLSAVVNIPGVPPSAPTLDVITPNPSTGRVQLNWSAVAGATSYKVYRASSNITDVTGLAPIDTPSVNQTTDFLTASGTYWYAVVATNTSGDGAVSNSESVVVTIPSVSFTVSKVFTLDIGVWDVTIVSADRSTIFVEFSLNVTSPVQMKVDVSSSGPSSPTLDYALRFYIFTVDSGSYNKISAKFYYDPSTLVQEQEENLQVFNLGNDGWNEIGGTPYLSTHYVFANLQQFSTYAVAIASQGGNQGNWNSPLIYVVILILVGAAILGVVVLVRLKKKTSITKPVGVDIQLDWNF